MIIRNRTKAKQLIDFTGLAYGSICPTDIDGFIEYKGIAYVYLEYKYKDAQMPKGQRIALERLVNDAMAAGKDAVLLLCSHDCPAEYDIDAATAMVTDIYYCGKWHHEEGETVKVWVDKFLKWSEQKHYGWLRWRTDLIQDTKTAH